MPLLIPKITKDLEAAIMAALKTEFAAEGVADTSSHQKIAAAVAKGVAQVIVLALQSDATVLAGIPTAGSPAAQVSVAPGKIF